MCGKRKRRAMVIDRVLAARERARRDRRIGLVAVRKLLLWTVQAFLGAVAGFAIGDSIVATRCVLLEPPSRGTLATVEVRILGVCVSKETGIAHLYEDEPSDGSTIRYVSVGQAAWVYGLPAMGAAIGLCSALVIGLLLCKSVAPARSAFACAADSETDLVESKRR